MSMCILKGKSKEVDSMCAFYAVKLVNNCIEYQKKILLTLILNVIFQKDCLNYIRVLQIVDENRLYVCGTYAFQPMCDYLVG